MQSFNQSLWVLGALALCMPGIPVWAQSITPANDGTGTIVEQTGNQIDINGGTISGDGATLFHGFREFGLSAGEIANFNATPEIQNILGRVTGGNASYINGLLQVSGSNANLFLLNPAGILFGSDFNLNLSGSFTATTADGISFGTGLFEAVGSPDYAALVGNPTGLVFAGETPAGLVNAGNITVAPGQTLRLIGGQVINTGTLSAPGGDITIAAVPGESFVRISQPGTVLGLELQTLGSVPTAPGNAVLTPLDLPALLTGSPVANASGVVVNADGTVSLTGSTVTIPNQPGVVIASGVIDASGASTTPVGGRVDVLGETVGVLGAAVDVSGEAGGGQLRVGGDYLGQGPVPNADVTVVDEASTINADATGNGDGGRVIVWSDVTSRIAGAITARGGLLGGDGGFVETSSAGFLDVDGAPDASAFVGSGGTWLIDPEDVVIDDFGGTSTNISTSNPFIATGGAAQLDINDLLAALTGGATVTVSTGASVGGSGEGDITLNADLDFNGTGSNTLRLEAYDDIFINGTIDDSDISTPDQLNIFLTTDTGNQQLGRAEINAPISSRGGSVQIETNNSREDQPGVTTYPGISFNSPIYSGGGDISFLNRVLPNTSGGNSNDNSYGIRGSTSSASIFSEGGDIRLEGLGFLSGIYIQGEVDSDNGNITIVGRGGQSAGIRLEGSVNSGSGDILLQGRSVLSSNIANFSPITSTTGNIIFRTFNNPRPGSYNFQPIFLNGDVTSLGGDIVFESAFSSARINTENINLSTSGNGIIRLETDGGDINVGDIFTSGAGIEIITNSGDIDTTNGTLTTTSNSGTAGPISIIKNRFRAGTSVSVGNLISTSPNGNGGDILIDSASDITTQDVNAQGRLSGGDITLRSGGFIDTTRGTLNSIGGIDGGRISLSAGADIDTADVAILVSSFNANSGDIDIVSSGGNVNTSRGVIAASAGAGNGGNITLDAFQRLTIADINATSIQADGGALTFGANDSVSLTTGIVETNNNDITFNRQVNLIGDASVISRGTGDVVFNATANGPYDLTLAAGNGVIQLNDAIGNQLPLSNFFALSDIITTTPTPVTIATTGNILTETITAAPGIALSSSNGQIVADDLSTADVGDAGDVLLNAPGSISLGSVNAQSLGSGTGADVEINSTGFVRLSDAFTDRNGLTASLSVAGGSAGGTSTIRHGGGGVIPFTVGDASINGSAGAISRGNDVPAERTIAPTQQFFPTYRQDSDRLQIIAVQQPPTFPQGIPVVPNLEPPPQQSSDIETLAVLLGDLLDAPVQMSVHPETNDYQFFWPSTGGGSSSIFQSVPNLDALSVLSLPADDLVSIIDQLFEEEYENHADENLSDKEVTAQTIRDNLSEIERQTGQSGVVLYAFSMAYGLELILVLPDGNTIRHVVPEAKRPNIHAVARDFRLAIDEVVSLRYREPGEQLYDWIIKPFESYLEALDIETLILCLEPELQGLPIAALFDGEQHLVEKYSLAAIPSFSLTDSRYQSLKDSQVLAMGVSDFSDWSLGELTAVPGELTAIGSLWPGETLLNEEATLPNLTARRQQAQFDVIHLATHADFQAGALENSYIQLWDTRLDMDSLRALRWYEAPQVEFLILSACQTAVGNLEAELGFAGLAVNAGVKSALASLWNVDDASTQVLMHEFYEELRIAPYKSRSTAAGTTSFYKRGSFAPGARNFPAGY
jgi:filamentous hemagglutinin family protein